MATSGNCRILVNSVGQVEGCRMQLIIQTVETGNCYWQLIKWLNEFAKHFSHILYERWMFLLGLKSETKVPNPNANDKRLLIMKQEARP